MGKAVDWSLMVIWFLILELPIISQLYNVLQIT